ncbi:hypothetical protein [Daejeonella oryzae]|uniref:hypothetical protein n=1 Tax=Daejeonella oryzae TaxID=1122943 RepID=UPI000400B004|nr:hypothetical protein [Daejeonella oryzae]
MTKNIYKIIFLLLSTAFFACNSEPEKSEENTDSLKLKTEAKVDSSVIETENPSISDCVRGKAEPIVKKSVFPNCVFKLNADGLTAIEKIELGNGDKVTIENTGCEYYVLNFRIETSKYQADTTDIPFWYNKAYLLMTELSKGIDSPIQINKGLEYLKIYMDKNQKIELGEEIDFGGNDIRDFLSLNRIEKLTENKFAIEISFATGPL